MRTRREDRMERPFAITEPSPARAGKGGQRSARLHRAGSPVRGPHAHALPPRRSASPATAMTMKAAPYSWLMLGARNSRHDRAHRPGDAVGEFVMRGL